MKCFCISTVVKNISFKRYIHVKDLWKNYQGKNEEKIQKHNQNVKLGTSLVHTKL